MAKKSEFEMCECPVCNKLFIPAPQHSYKVTDRFNRRHKVCSYSCVRKAEKDKKRWKVPKM